MVDCHATLAMTSYGVTARNRLLRDSVHRNDREAVQNGVYGVHGVCKVCNVVGLKGEWKDEKSKNSISLW